MPNFKLAEIGPSAFLERLIDLGLKLGQSMFTDDPKDTVEAAALRAQVLVNKIVPNPRDKKIIDLYYGLHPEHFGRPLTMRVIGRMVGLSPGYARRRGVNALEVYKFAQIRAGRQY